MSPLGEHKVGQAVFVEYLDGMTSALCRKKIRSSKLETGFAEQ